jgi:bacterioferritin-associated ferredoxin
MYVCICNALRERDVRRVAPDCGNAAEVYRALNCATRCGRCVPVVRSILAEPPAPQRNLDATATQPAAFAVAAE